MIPISAAQSSVAYSIDSGVTWTDISGFVGKWEVDGGERDTAGSKVMAAAYSRATMGRRGLHTGTLTGFLAIAGSGSNYLANYLSQSGPTPWSNTDRGLGAPDRLRVTNDANLGAGNEIEYSFASPVTASDGGWAVYECSGASVVFYAYYDGGYVAHGVYTGYSFTTLTQASAGCSPIPIGKSVEKVKFYFWNLSNSGFDAIAVNGVGSDNTGFWTSAYAAFDGRTSFDVRIIPLGQQTGAGTVDTFYTVGGRIVRRPYPATLDGASADGVATEIQFAFEQFTKGSITV